MSSNKLYIFKLNVFPSLGYLEPIKAESNGIQNHYTEEISLATIHQLPLLKFPRDLVISKGEKKKKYSFNDNCDILKALSISSVIPF